MYKVIHFKMYHRLAVSLLLAIFLLLQILPTINNTVLREVR